MNGAVAPPSGYVCYSFLKCWCMLCWRKARFFWKTIWLRSGVRFRTQLVVMTLFTLTSFISSQKKKKLLSCIALMSERQMPIISAAGPWPPSAHQHQLCCALLGWLAKTRPDGPYHPGLPTLPCLGWCLGKSRTTSHTRHGTQQYTSNWTLKFKLLAGLDRDHSSNILKSRFLAQVDGWHSAHQ